MELTLKLMDEITLRLKPAMDPTLTCGQRMRLFIHVVFDVGSENVDLCRLAHLGVESPIEEVGASMPDSPMFLNIVRMMQVSIDSGEMKLINSDFASSSLMRLTSGALQVAFCFSHGFDVGHPAVQERSVVGWESSEASQQRQARWSDISSGIKELRLRTPYVRSHAVDDCQIRGPRHLLRCQARALRDSGPLGWNCPVSDRAIFYLRYR